MDSKPKFRIEGSKQHPKVIIQCSACDKDIREMKKHESIKIDRGYYCEDCEDGAIHINLPKEEE